MALQLVRKKPQFGYAIIAALIFDVLDYAVIGAIPVYGDVADLVATGILYKFIGAAAIVGLVELIPFAGDFIPTYTLIVILAWLYKGSNRALR